MPLKFHCGCGCKIAVPSHYSGRSIRCPQCRERVTVPSSSSASGGLRNSLPLSSLVELPDPQPPPLPSAGAAAAGAAAAAAAAKAQQVESARESARKAAPPAGPGTHGTAPPTAHKPAPKPGRSRAAGYRPDRGKVTTVRLFAVALVINALAGLTPGVLELVEQLSGPEAITIARWTHLMFFVAAVQVAYALYFAQLPDWTSAWVVAMMTLVLATGYALLLSFTLLASDHGHFVELLELSGRLGDRRASGWSFIMLCLTAALSFFCGRFSIRWHEALQLSRGR